MFWRCLADDSQWTNDRRNDAGWLPSGLLPETTLGWIVTVLAIAGILVLLQRSTEPAFAAGGQQLGSAANTASAAAFLRALRSTFRRCLLASFLLAASRAGCSSSALARAILAAVAAAAKS